jgi:S1-C subfamily serine protease
VALGAAVLCVPRAAHAGEGAWSRPALNQQELSKLRSRVAAASVILPEKSCAGAIAGDSEHVVTAAHCVPVAAYRVKVKLRSGAPLSADIAFLDREGDLALLRLPHAVAVSPLGLSSADVAPGARVHFVGRSDRAIKPQLAQVQRLGRCPSLPDVPHALFTSVSARPGDSGAPLVDDDGRLVGVIHGGSSCHIAAPTAPLARRFAELATQPAPSAPLEAPSQALPREGADDDSDDDFVFERTPGGFRFRWSFRWSSSG